MKESAPLFGKINQEIEHGALLLNRRTKTIKPKTREKMGEACGVKGALIDKWEKGESFPPEDKLSIIAEAYGITIDELTRVFKLSKSLREQEKMIRNGLRKAPSTKSKISEEEMFPGKIESLKSVSQMNPEQTPQQKLGRQ